MSLGCLFERNGASYERVELPCGGEIERVVQVGHEPLAPAPGSADKPIGAHPNRPPCSASAAVRPQPPPGYSALGAATRPTTAQP